MVPKRKELRFADERPDSHAAARENRATFTPELVTAYRDALDETRRLQHETLRRGRPQLHLVRDAEPAPRIRADILEGYFRNFVGRCLLSLCLSVGLVTAVLAWRAFVLSLEAL